MIVHRAIALALALSAAPSCFPSDATGVPIEGEGRRALFVGNSYVVFGDIPGIVQALADSAGGDRIAIAVVAGPNVALIDHWNQGPARETISRGGWEWVILQQGPSSLDISRDTLLIATRLFAPVIRQTGAMPALFSAWPASNRTDDFARAIESYRIAADEVNGLFLPIASAWVAARQRLPGIQLYADNLHASSNGAYLSALVIYASLLDRTPVGLPASLRLRSGSLVSLDPAVAAVLQAAAAEATGR